MILYLTEYLLVPSPDVHVLMMSSSQKCFEHTRFDFLSSMPKALSHFFFLLRLLVHQMKFWNAHEEF